MSAGSSLKFNVLQPKHPERICWGCDKYCPAGELACGNGTIRTPHPIELLGEDWMAERPARRKPDSEADTAKPAA